MADVSEIIASNALDFTAFPASANPLMPQGGDGMNHWFCTFSGDRLSGFEFYVSLGSDYANEAPTAELALSLLVADVRAFRECEGYEDFARLVGVDDDDSSGEAVAYAAFEELGRLAPLVDEVLDVGPAPLPVP